MTNIEKINALQICPASFRVKKLNPIKEQALKDLHAGKFNNEIEKIIRNSSVFWYHKEDIAEYFAEEIESGEFLQDLIDTYMRRYANGYLCTDDFNYIKNILEK